MIVKAASDAIGGGAAGLAIVLVLAWVAWRLARP